MIIKSTKDDAARYTRILGYGASGAGKTFAIKDLDNPFVFSFENGLASLKKYNVAYGEINSVEEMFDAYRWLDSSEAKQYQVLCIDSLSKAAALSLERELNVHKHGQAAYGEMAVTILKFVNALCKKNMDLYCIAQLDRTQDELGRLLYSPSMPGKVLGQALPYIFDNVMALHVSKDANGKIQSAWQCQADGIYHAKDRGGELSMWEKPNLQSIINKTKGIKS
jgi:phage nucleotide-binding protein